MVFVSSSICPVSMVMLSHKVCLQIQTHKRGLIIIKNGMACLPIRTPSASLIRLKWPHRQWWLTRKTRHVCHHEIWAHTTFTRRAPYGLIHCLRPANMIVCCCVRCLNPESVRTSDGCFLCVEQVGALWVMTRVTSEMLYGNQELPPTRKRPKRGSCRASNSILAYRFHILKQQSEGRIITQNTENSWILTKRDGAKTRPMLNILRRFEALNSIICLSQLEGVLILVTSPLFQHPSPQLKSI